MLLNVFILLNASQNIYIYIEYEMRREKSVANMPTPLSETY